jgi:hypothetical protein
MSKDQLQTQSYVIMGILILQYLFGMAVNLFVQFPDSKNEGQLWEFAQSQWYLIVHIFFALGLLISGVVLLIRAIRRKDRNWINAAGRLFLCYGSCIYPGRCLLRMGIV